MKTLSIIITALLLGSTFCRAQGYDNVLNDVGALLDAGAVPTYQAVIQPIFKNRCLMCHHAGGPPTMPNWMDYATAYAKRDLIYQHVVVKKDMPMSGTMTDTERALVGAWVQGGAPL